MWEVISHFDFTLPLASHCEYRSVFSCASWLCQLYSQILDGDDLEEERVIFSSLFKGLSQWIFAHMLHLNAILWECKAAETTVDQRKRQKEMGGGAGESGKMWHNVSHAQLTHIPTFNSLSWRDRGLVSETLGGVILTSLASTYSLWNVFTKVSSQWRHNGDVTKERHNDDITKDGLITSGLSLDVRCRLFAWRVCNASTSLQSVIGSSLQWDFQPAAVFAFSFSPHSRVSNMASIWFFCYWAWP